MARHRLLPMVQRTPENKSGGPLRVVLSRSSSGSDRPPPAVRLNEQNVRPWQLRSRRTLNMERRNCATGMSREFAQDCVQAKKLSFS
jgi:hypothetical protein